MRARDGGDDNAAVGVRWGLWWHEFGERMRRESESHYEESGSQSECD